MQKGQKKEKNGGENVNLKGGNACVFYKRGEENVLTWLGMINETFVSAL